MGFPGGGNGISPRISLWALRAGGAEGTRKKEERDPFIWQGK